MTKTPQTPQEQFEYQLAQESPLIYGSETRDIARLIRHDPDKAAEICAGRIVDWHPRDTFYPRLKAALKGRSASASSWPMLGARSVRLSRADYGTRWPFTVGSGRLWADRAGRVVFVAELVHYGVNGAATASGFAPIDPIWRDDPDIPGGKVHIGPIIERGLALWSDRR